MDFLLDRQRGVQVDVILVRDEVGHLLCADRARGVLRLGQRRPRHGASSRRRLISLQMDRISGEP